MQSGRGTLPISLCMASMPAHVECKPWAGTFDSLTWAPAPCLACEMVPFFPNKNALHPCTLIVNHIYIFTRQSSIQKKKVHSPYELFTLPQNLKIQRLKMFENDKRHLQTTSNHQVLASMLATSQDLTLKGS